VTVGKECRQPPIDQLALCGRWAGCSVAAAGHRASCHQRWTTRHRRRRRGGRAPPASRAWAACCRRSVMRWSASTWLSPACWLFMSLPFPSCGSAQLVSAPSCPADRGAGPIPSASRIAPRPWQALLAVREGRRQQATAAAGAQPEDLARRRGQRSSSAGVHAPPPSSRLPDSRRKSPGRSSRWRSCGHGAAMHPRRADPSTWPTVLGVASRRRAARLPPRPRSTADQRRVQAWSMLWRRRRRGASAAPRCRRRGARASTRMLEPTPASRRSPRPARARCRQGLPRLARVHHDRRRAAAAARPPPPVARTAAVAAPQQPAPAITGGVSGTGGRSPAHR
jgi:hypothetical protein